MTKFVDMRKVMDAETIAQAATAYTTPVMFDMTTGYAAILVTSSAGSVTITQQASDDNINWYDPVDSAGTALGSVVTAMTVGTKYITVSPVICRYIRYKVVENNSAGTVVTVKLIMQEE